ncbi:MAG: hypothetical protein LH606_03185 [Cytophagaceae bacterium]|nr:hypothetical protein [Cytophagaceae bacterium]
MKLRGPGDLSGTQQKTVRENIS